jgi:hypothetical protein
MFRYHGVLGKDDNVVEFVKNQMEDFIQRFHIQIEIIFSKELLSLLLQPIDYILYFQDSPC